MSSKLVRHDDAAVALARVEAVVGAAPQLVLVGAARALQHVTELLRLRRTPQGRRHGLRGSQRRQPQTAAVCTAKRPSFTTTRMVLFI